MKSVLPIPFVLATVIALTHLSCSKEELPEPGENTDFPFPVKTGELMIYRVDECKDGSTRLWLDGSLLGEYSTYNSERDCGDLDDENAGIILDKPPGTYHLVATTNGGNNEWESDLVVKAEDCTKAELRCYSRLTGNAVIPGKVTVFVDGISCGFGTHVSVSVRDSANTYTTVLLPADPNNVDCENSQAYGYKYILNPGIYLLTAAEQDGLFRTWTVGDLTISSGDCFTFRLWCY